MCGDLFFVTYSIYNIYNFFPSNFCQWKPEKADCQTDRQTEGEGRLGILISVSHARP